MANREPDCPLTSLYLYLTDYCNLTCGHCWISPKRSQRRQEGLPLEHIQTAIREAKPLGLQSVKLTGGEPLMYSHLDGLLRFLRSESLNVNIETNGTLLDHNTVETLASCKVEQVSVSLDAATADVHDEIRGVKGSFQHTLRGLRLLADFGLNFQIIMTLQRKNSDGIPDVLSLSEDLGAASLKINHLIRCGRAKAYFDRGENLNLDELIRLYYTVEEKRTQVRGTELIFDLPVVFRSIGEIKHRGVNECRILNILSILANGDFSICGIGQTIDELRLGNLSRISLAEVWKSSSVLNGLRESLPYKLGGICQDCIFKFQCLGACRANAYAMTGDLYAPYFLCQELYESGRFPHSRYVGAKVGR